MEIGTTQNDSTSQTDLGSTSWGAAAGVTLTKGTWIIHGWARFAQNSTGYRGVAIARNSAEIGNLHRILGNAVSGNATMLEVNEIVSIDNSQVYNIYLIQSSGSSLKVDSYIEAIKIN